MGDSQGQFSKLTAFFETCQKSVFQQSCSSDSQCYSGKCDSHSGFCRVPWGDEAGALSACFMDVMPPEVRFELKAIWQLPAVFANATAERLALAQAFEERLFQEDCVGPRSYEFRSRVEYVKQPDGKWERVERAGNQTGCLLEKTCSYRPWENRNVSPERLQCNYNKTGR